MSTHCYLYTDEFLKHRYAKKGKTKLSVFYVRLGAGIGES